MSITKENYDEYVKKSFFTEKNFSGKYSPSSLKDNMIPCDKIVEFHYQTSFFLNFYATLYIELKKYEKDMTYNITKFADTIENLVINIDNATATADILKISAFSSNKYTFYVKTFEAKTTTQNQLYTTGSLGANVAYDSAYSAILLESKPHFGLNQNTLVPNTSTNINYLTKKQSAITGRSESQFLNSNLTKSNYLSEMPDNVSKFKEILGEVFSQTPENILGYLLYKKIYYNIILYNIAIQNSIITNYLYKTISGIENISNFVDDILSAINTTNLNPIITQITYNNLNIKNLIKIHFSNNNNEFLLEKNEYRNKINTLNNLRDEYKKIQDKLNISTKLYNQQLKNYKSIKTYATYVIISLIIIIISIIYISIFPIFSIETKNALYIILLVLLVIITFLYYTNFKYVNLYEKFADVTDAATITFTTGDIITFSNTLQHKNNNINIYNFLLPSINEYSNAYNELLNNMRLNVYTIGSKSFSQDANIYLYNLYVEKKRQLEINKVKLTNFFNMIEVIKKQINYLFNIIFFIACFSIILLIALVIYSTAPHLYIFVIILCIVLISILMIYFTFAIIQPTRMIANKNYWAILNPSKTTYSKL